MNVQFQFPVVSDRKALVQRLKYAWEKVNLIALRKITKHNIVKIWESKLDKLFDITTCQCPITLCKETKESSCINDCTYKAHIQCSCSKDKKLPLLELAWMKYQQDKVGSKSKQQIISEDMTGIVNQNK